MRGYLCDADSCPDATSAIPGGHVKVYALVTAEAPPEAVDVFLRRDDAKAGLEDCLRDEPGWVDVLSVVPVELDERDVSTN